MISEEQQKIIYDENSIDVLEGLEAVRKRPAMYIGNGGRFAILKEALDNAIDEATAGYSKRVKCVVQDDLTFFVCDEGRGIPVGIHPKFEKQKISTLEIILTKLHAGGKLRKGAYSGGSIGTHGVGISCTNALSKHFQCWTFRDGNWYTETFEYGKPTSKVVKIPSTKLPFKQQKGTIVKFVCDETILKSPLNKSEIKDYLENCSFLNSGIQFVYEETATNTVNVFKSSGLLDFITKITTKDGEQKFENLGKPFSFKNETVDVCLQWFESDDTNLTSWVNSSKTVEGGTHVDGLVKVITNCFGKLAKKKNYKPEDLRVGLYGGLNYRVAEPQFDSQTKEKLINPDATKIVYEVLEKEFDKYLNSNKSFTKRIIDRANEMRSIYNKFVSEKKALSKVKTKGKASLPPPTKFVISNCKDDNLRELFICLRGDTEILDVNGKSYKIQDLAENPPNEFYGFGVDEKTNEIRPTKLYNFSKTSDGAKLVRVHLDNGTYFDCTPDHRILCKQPDRQKGFKTFYKQAKDLSVGQSLVNLTLYEEDGYLKYYQPIENYKSVKVHQQVYDYYVGKRNSSFEDVHHKNEVKTNNYPHNLEKMTHGQHSRQHGILVDYWMNPLNCLVQSNKIKSYFSKESIRNKHSQKMKEAMKKVDFSNIRKANKKYAFFRAEKRIEILKKQTEAELVNFKKTGIYTYKRGYSLNLLKHFINEDAMLYYFSKNAFDFEHFLKMSFLDCSKERLLQIASLCLKEKSTLSFSDMQEFCIRNNLQKPLVKNILKHFKDEKELEQLALAYNHKVVKVEHLGGEYPTYCCKSDTNNFFLKNGICAHNCEGESAGGTAKAARNPYYQEILKLKGKILNTAKANLSKVYESEDILNILKAIGFDPVNRNHNIRVGKVIILTDADVDGSHISTLLLTLFKFYYPELLEQGRVFCVDAPLFIGKTRTKTLYGADLQDLQKQSGNEKLLSVTRLKGWGEASANLLKTLAFDPSTRNLIQIQDVTSKQDLDLFKKLVGEDTEIRKQLLFQK